MRLVFAGTPEVAVPSLEALLASRHEVVAVVTRPDARTGRGRTLRPSPVKERAVAAGIEVLSPASARDPEFLERLRVLAPDAAPVVAYGNLVPRAALDIPTHGWLNLHFSLLPAWRGAAPVQHALIAGDERTGACVFRLEEGLDTGAVAGRLVTPISDEEDAGALLDRLAVDGAELLVEVLDAIEDGSAQFVPQEGEPTLAPKLTRDHGRIDWRADARTVRDLIRGCTPAPGAWTVYDDAPVKVSSVRLAPQEPALPPGAVRVGRTAVHVGTGGGVLELLRVQPPGKKPMAAADWARGARIDGAVFASTQENDS